MSDKMVQEVNVQSRPVEAFVDILGPEAVRSTRRMAEQLCNKLGSRTIWNVNTSAAGGGVAEMLHTLLSYARELGVRTRWLVVGGNAEFSRVTRRLHDALHGKLGDGSALDLDARRIYDQVTRANLAELNSIIQPGDVAILHDPPTVGLIPHLVQRGVGVIWRCHVGNDVPSAEGDRAWAFLEDDLREAHGFVFSRFSYLPRALYHGRCLVVPPSIDPFSPKNQAMDDSTVRSVLTHLGVINSDASSIRRFTRADGSAGTVERRAQVLREGIAPSADTPLVVQVSRWDRLKDPIGVLEGFNRATEDSGVGGAHLVLAGPSVTAADDDPDGAQVFEEVATHWRSLSADRRCRVHLVNLPMVDLEENAAMVNALQRHASVVVQKSLREGFGLTVTEAMWKSRPVLASAVGGIQDQIEHGVSGLLLKDPCDLDAFAGAVRQAVTNPGFAARLGRNAHRRVTHNFLGLSIVEQYDDLVARLDHDPKTEGRLVSVG